MWWLFGRKSGTKSGKIVKGKCPFCNQQTQCQEIVKSSQTSVWFVPVSGGEEVEGYVCMQCGSQFRGFASYPEDKQVMRGCLTSMIIIIIAMAVVFSLFGFNWWLLIGILISGFFILIGMLPSQEVKEELSNRKRHVSKSKKSSSLNVQVDRNLEGKRLEKNGQIDKTIELYEKNVEEGFDGSHPYARLAIIYRKRKQFDDEIRILEKAVSLYENQYKKGINCQDDLDKFKKRLEKAKKLK